MPQQAPLDAPDVVEGVVDHLLYVGFDERTVLRLAATSGAEETITAHGTALFGVQPGESLRLQGSWNHHPRHGRQFRVEQCDRTMPAGERAIRLYLASGMIRGIGPVLASAIVDAFGEQTLKVIDAEAVRLLEVHGIGQVRLGRIRAAWQEQKAIAEIMVFLQGLQVSPALAVKIYTAYQDTDDDPMLIVRRTPYRLCRDVYGVGFRNADRIALAVGIAKHSEQRLQAALIHELDEAGLGGHCHLTTRVLIARTRALLSDDDPQTAQLLEDTVLRHALQAVCAQGDIVIETLPLPAGDGTVTETQIAMRPRQHRDETQLAFHVRRLLAFPSSLAGLAPWGEHLAELRGTDTAGLTEEQHQAVLTALTHPVSVLTGGPGCGKTHTLRTLVDLVDAAGAVVALAAPTGKAAKRLQETCGQNAMTVHRLIRPPDGDSLFDHASILESADLVVVDEASMLDLSLARRLAVALRNGCHLLLVGDINQLPSVGPGRVLRDLLDVEDIPRTRLTKVFRQHDDSATIVLNAHRILHGELPRDDSKAFWNRPVASAEEIAQQVVDLVADKMPQHFTISPQDVQVLCPGKKNVAGMTDLNLRLQERLNPPTPDKPQHYHGGTAFRLGDRVQQVRNNGHRGESGVFNGTSGIITAVESDTHHLTVTFDDGEHAVYPFADLDELVHAYALTVHRSQGSEYPFVIVPMVSAAGMMLLQRNLLYTAVTRARRGVMLIGQSDAVERAVANNHTQRRNTALTHRITHAPISVPAPRDQAAGGQLAWD
ncbi:ATP-dependent RecD-like DNA helicase [Streptomyces sp. H10-C2]|uniref:SF1B family DNA helicase RecD2 n=1 Tax=unclassified Streptomyces TaxID=2593676 RepID=UPI0024B9CE70|nr:MULTISPECIES: ATP-dependent RecD-like DNA helicase [unclassified Streptomyces]MDJ0347203.1 ATP-dependent RecD-like DNA helicase [Streptomyces sp. PH10-H1]MDJ0375448.1 ATP-dependent RecD-like DNA helicase [Streptomyces sp. H10-C2]